MTTTIWITGASSGIGEACAYELAKDKPNLILTGTREDKLREVQARCQVAGAHCEVLPYDLSHVDGIPDLVERALACFGRVDIMFNNAGISQRAKAADTAFEVDRKIMEVNFFAPVRIAKLLLPYMLRQGGGMFVTTSSISGRFGFPGSASRCGRPTPPPSTPCTASSNRYGQSITTTASAR